MKKFFKKLRKYYNGDDQRFRVKYYAQCTSFSYDIYSVDTAFHGTPVFRSDVFYFWDTEEHIRIAIIAEIEGKLKELNNK